jgi:hypothetical protein
MNSYQQRYYDLLCTEAKPRGYTVTGNYVNAKTLVNMMCDKGHHIQIRAGDFKQGKGCAKCAGCCPIQAQEDFRNIAVLSSYVIIGTYINTNKPVEVICDKGHNISISPSAFKIGGRCAKCSLQCPVQAEESFRQLAQQRQYTIIGDYKNNRASIEMICNKGHTIKMTPTSFKSGCQCIKCARKCPIESEKDFMELTRHRKYTVIGKYVNNTTNVDMICDQNHLVSIRPINFKNGNGCIKCSGHCPIEAEKSFKDVAQRKGYTIIGPYINADTQVQIICNRNHQTRITPHCLKRGRGCGICNESKGGQLISETLDYLKIVVKPQYRFPNTDRYYDFGFNYLGYGGIIIEWDGEQHFVQIPYFHDKKKTLDERKDNDIHKTKEVLIRGFKLIRIDYTWINKGVEELADFIVKAIQDSHSLILSIPDMYSWLTDNLFNLPQNNKQHQSTRITLKIRTY